jgi:hypothetical protein
MNGLQSLASGVCTESVGRRLSLLIANDQLDWRLKLCRYADIRALLREAYEIPWDLTGQLLVGRICNTAAYAVYTPRERQ